MVAATRRKADVVGEVIDPADVAMPTEAEFKEVAVAIATGRPIARALADRVRESFGPRLAEAVDRLRRRIAAADALAAIGDDPAEKAAAEAAKIAAAEKVEAATAALRAAQGVLTLAQAEFFEAANAGRSIAERRKESRQSHDAILRQSGVDKAAEIRRLTATRDRLIVHAQDQANRLRDATVHRDKILARQPADPSPNLQAAVDAAERDLEKTKAELRQIEPALAQAETLWRSPIDGMRWEIDP